MRTKRGAAALHTWRSKAGSVGLRLLQRKVAAGHTFGRDEQKCPRLPCPHHRNIEIKMGEGVGRGEEREGEAGRSGAATHSGQVDRARPHRLDAVLPCRRVDPEGDLEARLNPIRYTFFSANPRFVVANERGKVKDSLKTASWDLGSGWERTAVSSLRASTSYAKTGYRV